MKARRLVGLLAALGLAGCGLLPTAGPTVKDVLKQQAEDHRFRFDLVNIDSNVVRTLAALPNRRFPARFKKYHKPPQPKIGVGDTIVVTIWEASGGGLFGTAAQGQVAGGSHSVTLPEQVVGTDGSITVPFAGRVHVAGHFPAKVERIIERRLAGKAIEPQAIVTIEKSASDYVTVTGEVVSGARVPLSPNGERLLDVIASAGGAKSPLYQTFVKLSRHGITATIPLETLVSDPAENIYAQPGDVLTLVRRPQTFSVFGAAGKNADLPFTGEKMSLVEALAEAGGLRDERSDPAGVFLFRFEPSDVVNALGRPQLRTGPEGTTPVVYRLNLEDAKSYFLAQRFPVENKDIIYVANAQLDELQKFFRLLNTLTGPVITGIVVHNSAP